ncbi:MAG: hypothetical protein HY928_13095 [Elusimicrobia bacterium]|nr:hypothetical protein [Elusimicrobiota bacterium]
MHWRTLALTFVLLARWAPCAAEVKPKPYLMASMGDSITAALFGGTVLTTSTQAFVTMDDVESAFLGSRLFEKKYTLSWSSGKDIPSHFVQLRDYLKAKEGAELEVLNTATTGNKAEDLIAQARAVSAAMASGNYRGLKYATILIGANDVCFGGGPTGTPDGVMRDSLKAALGLLASIPQDEPVRVFVSAMPNVPALGDPAIRETPFLFDITCGMLWSRLGICQPILAWKNPDEYRARTELLARKNAALRQALVEAAAENPNLRVAYSDSVFLEPLKRGNLAADCFHPNKDTQTRIGVELWKEQPWFPPSGEQALERTRAAVSRARETVEERLEAPTGL